MIYLKYNRHDKNYPLKQAYLIGRDTLQRQIISILNQLMEKADYPTITKGEGSLKINQKITKAYLTVKKDPSILSNLNKNLELFMINNHNPDIMLKIPEDYLNDYTKVDKDGNIIFNSK